MRRAIGRAVSLALLLAAAPASAQTPPQPPAIVAGGGDGAAPIGDCGGDLKRLNQISGWQLRWPAQLAQVAALSETERATALARWRTAPTALAADLAGLREGMAAGRAAPRAVVDRVLGQVEALRGAPIAPSLTDRDWRAFLDGEFKQAIADYARFLRDDYRPHAPDGSALAASAAGHACFERAAKSWTSRTLTAPAIEAIGTRLMDRYRAELIALTGVAPAELPALLDRLRTPADAQVDRAEIQRVSEAAIARATAALPRYFDGPAPGPLSVEPIAPALEKSLPAGFYEPTAGGRPAVYRINLSNAPERRLMAEVIAFHEGLPGHHLGIDSAGGRGAFNAGFVEGWGIYAEHLADELGLYSSKADRIGMVAKHLWAASRLVVEPGLHIHGWSRDKAIAYLRANTALPPSEIEVEVDRYLAMPGQSLSYMIGYESIMRARAAAERKRGKDFDLRSFHRMLLLPGPRPLDTMEREFD